MNPNWAAIRELSGWGDKRGVVLPAGYEAKQGEEISGPVFIGGPAPIPNTLKYPFSLAVARAPAVESFKNLSAQYMVRCTRVRPASKMKYMPEDYEEILAAIEKRFADHSAFSAPERMALLSIAECIYRGFDRGHSESPAVPGGPAALPEPSIYSGISRTIYGQVKTLTERTVTVEFVTEDDREIREFDRAEIPSVDEMIKQGQPVCVHYRMEFLGNRGPLSDAEVREWEARQQRAAGYLRRSKTDSPILDDEDRVPRP
jgi:hypothetical protein